jgi:hypothetical protein
MDPMSHVYQGCDWLLTLVKEELTRHEITEPTHQRADGE